jgi:signal transduction histidine kinase
MSFPSDVSLELDPELTDAQRQRKAYHLNVVTFPRFRWLGMFFLLFATYLHNRYVLGEVEPLALLKLGQFLASYALLSWGILRLFYQKKPFLGLAFLILDVFVWTVVIYAMGGHQCVAFFLLLSRVGDQTHTSVSRVMAFAHLIVVAYVLMLLYSFHGAGHTFVWSAELSKAFLLYLCGLYIALSAIPAERLRGRLLGVMRQAREYLIDLRRANQELELAREAAERASVSKSEFLSTISHELRTPLNGIIGYGQLLKDGVAGPLNEQQDKFLAQSLKSAELLTELIDSLLDFSSLDTRQELDLAPMDFAKEFLSAATSLEAVARAKQIDFEIGDTPACHLAQADAGRISQVLMILMGNAIKFTSQGRVFVGYRVEENSLYAWFEDSGVGVEPADQERIFEKFEQADGSYSRRWGGCGLGLAIAKKLISMHRGEIGVESLGKDQGSIFWFRIPL